MDLSPISDLWPYLVVFLLGLAPSLPVVGKWILYLKGIPQLITKHSPDIRRAIASDPSIKKETADAIFMLLNWLEKLVEISPISTSRAKSEKTLKTVSEKINGGSK